jgi:hypothetical protein
MNMKNFLLAGIAGGITDFLLGWLLYGMLFHDYFGGEEPNLGLIAAGCLCFGFLMSYIYVGLAGIASLAGGMKAGAVIGLISGLMHNFFQRSMENPVNWEQCAVDVVISIIMGCVVGGVVGAVNGSSKPAAAV